MSDLFRRQWRIHVGTIRIEGLGAGDGAERAGLDCAFEIESTVQREPNTASLKIWNLSPQHRRILESSSTLPVQVEAGYLNATSVLFAGDVRVSESRRRAAMHRTSAGRYGRLGKTNDIVDVCTEIEAEDGGTAWRSARVQRSYSAGTSVSAVLADCVDALGIGRGNLADFDAAARIAGGDIQTYNEGTVLTGAAHAELDRIVRSCGLTWSVQKGALQLRGGAQSITMTAVRLSPGSGLLGSPSVGADGYVTATSLLNGTLSPGRPVVLESRDVSGSYSVRRVRHVGDTAGADWFSELTLEAR